MKTLLVTLIASGFMSSAFAADTEKAPRKPAMGPPENECVFKGSKAEEWFNKIPRITSTCHYMESDSNGIKLCDDDMASVMCKKVRNHYKCVATTLAVGDVKESCQGPELPTL